MEENNDADKCPAIRTFFPEFSQLFKSIERISDGSFGSVYKATVISTGDLVALKHILPISHPNRICRELICLYSFNGHSNIINILTCTRSMDSVLLVMPYFEHHKFQDFFLNLAYNDILCYLSGLLSALEHIHKFHIMHRDIKPGNYLYNVNTKTGILVDFGLATTAFNKQSFLSNYETVSDNICAQPLFGSIKNLEQCDHKRDQVCTTCLSKPRYTAPRGGTSGFRAPEVLLRCYDQGTPIDIWSVGVILLSFLSGRFPFFNAIDDITNLAQIVFLIGPAKMKSVANTLGRNLEFNFKTSERELDWECFKLIQDSKTVWDHPNPKESPIYDLLLRLLEPNPSLRITATEALNHKIFANFSRSLM